MRWRVGSARNAPTLFWMGAIASIGGVAPSATRSCIGIGGGGATSRCATRFAHTPDWLPSSINFGEMRVLFAKKDDMERIKSACALLQRDRTAALYSIIAQGL